jgi:hypothetical protein
VFDAPLKRELLRTLFFTVVFLHRKRFRGKCSFLADSDNDGASFCIQRKLKKLASRSVIDFADRKWPNAPAPIVHECSTHAQPEAPVSHPEPDTSCHSLCTQSSRRQVRAQRGTPDNKTREAFWRRRSS